MIKGLKDAREKLATANVKMPFEKGYEEWNKARKEPAAEPSKVIIENAEKAAKEEVKKLQEIAAAAENKAKSISESKAETK